MALGVSGGWVPQREDSGAHAIRPDSVRTRSPVNARVVPIPLGVRSSECASSTIPARVLPIGCGVLSPCCCLVVCRLADCFADRLPGRLCDLVAAGRCLITEHGLVIALLRRAVTNVGSLVPLLSALVAFGAACGVWPINHELPPMGSVYERRLCSTLRLSWVWDEADTVEQGVDVVCIY